MLLRESQVQPLLLVCEDLHWIDAETQALLDTLVDSLPTVQMLLLANYRPEYQHGWGSKTYYTQLRLDPLPPESADELLQAIAELPEDARHRTLTHLQTAEFLYETSLFPELVYTFKHALTRDVAYGGLLHKRRGTLHGRVGVAIEALYPERLAEFSEVLAHHFEQGEVWAKTVHYHFSAVEKANDQTQEFLRNNDLEGVLRFWAALILSESGLGALAEQFVKACLALPKETILSFFDPDPEMDIGPLLGAVSMPTLSCMAQRTATCPSK